jgi:Asp-tRNA(Asn)/Glu-tRNA(Gln) amidotransferase A subunit family amidase
MMGGETSSPPTASDRLPRQIAIVVGGSSSGSGEVAEAIAGVISSSSC